MKQGGAHWLFYKPGRCVSPPRNKDFVIDTNVIFPVGLLLAQSSLYCFFQPPYLVIFLVHILLSLTYTLCLDGDGSLQFHL
ncbi:hypothetical protein BDV26DRAFT_162573 [Aspergillus bertholletiae]|uniref:Uncharacterized protein n=1 Tax=Aspergillus bertholletiae TaxID=1226010 RepID=A0A5N7BCT5_9EURO|nr:hypothetical protein BDV26DRAFT_162573 [Aspergillus bertholletiae]